MRRPDGEIIGEITYSLFVLLIGCASFYGLLSLVELAIG